MSHRKKSKDTEEDDYYLTFTTGNKENISKQLGINFPSAGVHDSLVDFKAGLDKSSEQYISL